MKTYCLLVVIAGGLAGVALAGSVRPPGMVWIPDGEFVMGTDEREAYPAERPAPRVNVDGFRVDATEPLCRNPAGPAHSFNPREPHAQQRVTKGGSFLCEDNYCVNYRSSARRGTDHDTGMSHLGFRCVLTPAPRDQSTPERTPIKK